MKSPFKFLDSYTKDDRESYFGRNQETEELYQKVFESKLLLIYGVSGTGKSSLVHCGLANKFLETDWLPIVIRRGKNITESLAAGIRNASITENQNKYSTPVDFKKGIKSLYLDHYKPVFLIFDQFEELFIFGGKDERREFISIVKTLTESDLQCRIIFVMREEYMAGVTEFERYIPTFLANRVRIERMSHTNALEAITEPAKVFGINLEEGFADALLEKLSPGNEEVELTYLQVYLDKLFRLAQAKNENGQQDISFSLRLLNKAGNVTDLLGSFIDEQVSVLDDPETGLSVLKTFVSLKGTIRQMTAGEVLESARALGRQVDANVLQDILQSFVNLRILREKDKNGRYELKHDALAIKIFEKITLVEKEVLEIRNFIENAYNNWQKRGVLLSAVDLDYIAPYESRLYLSYELQGLIEKSRNELARARKRRRVVLTLSTVLLLITFASFTVWALIERKKSEKQEIMARANYFSSLSKEFLEKDPTIAFRLAEYAYSLNPSKAIRENLINIYSTNEFYQPLSEEGKLKVYLDYNFRLMSGSGDIVVSFWDQLNTFHSDGSLKESIFHDYQYFTFEVSPDEQYFLIYAYDDTVRLFDIKGKEILKKKINPDPRMFSPLRVVYFFPDSKKFLTYNMVNEIDIWSVTGDLLNRSTDLPSGLTILPPNNPSELQMGSTDGKILTWDFNTNKFSSVNLGLKNGQIASRHIRLRNGNVAIYRSDDEICIYNKNGKLISNWQTIKKPDIMLGLLDRDILLIVTEKKLTFMDYEGNEIKTLSCGTPVMNVQEDTLNKRLLIGSMAQVVTYPLDNLYYPIILKSKNKVGFNCISNSILELDKAKSIFNVYDLSGHNTSTINLPDDFKTDLWSINDNIILSTGSKTPFMTLFDINKRELIKYENLNDQPAVFCISMDGSIIATSGIMTTNDTKTSIITSFSTTVELWDRKGLSIGTLNCSEPINCIDISSDGTLILTASGNDAILFNANGSVIDTLAGHSDLVTSVDISEDGKNFLTASFDNTTRLWSYDGTIKVLVSESIDTPFETKTASFFGDDKYFMTYDSYTSNPIKIYGIDGKIIQVIPAEVDGKCSYSKKDNAIVYFDGAYKGLLKVGIKEPVDSYSLRNNYKYLNTIQMIEYGLTSTEEIQKKGNPIEMASLGDYLIGYKLINLTDSQERLAVLKDAEIAFRKSLFNTTDSVDVCINLNDIYIQKSILLNSDESKNINKVFEQIYGSAKGFNLLYAANYYLDISEKSDHRYGFPVKSLKICKKALETNSQFRQEISNICSDISYHLILQREYPDALDAAFTSLKANPVNSVTYTNLSLAHLMNGRYAEAEKIYSEMKDSIWTSDNTAKSFGEVFLKDIHNLESKGITHPDFEKVKKLLEN